MDLNLHNNHTLVYCALSEYLAPPTPTSSFVFIYLFIFKIYFIYLFLAALGLRCCAWAFSSCSEQGLLFIVVCGLLIAVASLVAEHGLQVRGLQQLWRVGSAVAAHGPQSTWASVVVACRLQSAGSVVVAHGLSCSAALGSSWTRAGTRVPCIGRWILNHCTTREALRLSLAQDGF